MSFWSLALVCYLAVGLLSAFYGILARKFRWESLVLHMHSAPAAKVRSFIVTLRLIAVVAWPVLYGMVLIDWLRSKRTPSETVNLAAEPCEAIQHGLRFTHMGGAGELQCNDCGWNAHLKSFVHDLDEWCVAAYQCQDCGRFEHFESLDTASLPPCACGGGFSREEIILCPRCQGRALEWQMHYIT